MSELLPVSQTPSLGVMMEPEVQHGAKMAQEQLEIERLRREVQRLKAERDILKKAAAYFAKENM
jgi:transposase-like protein